MRVRIPPKRPEDAIRDAISDFLMARGWYVFKTHGNAYQAGFPDLYATHTRYGQRLIEVKLPNMKGSAFTKAQWEVFPKLHANGSRIWILTAATEEEYAKLWKESNLLYYMSSKT